MSSAKIPTFNHAYTIGFEISGSSEANAADVTGAQLREALQSRLASLTDDQLKSACDSPFDTHEEE
jgi:hypothetical protein